METPESDAGRAAVLLKQIGTETRRSELDNLLSELQRLPTIPDCSVLLPLTKHRWWQVRWGAIDALAKCRDDRRAEAALLAVLANPVDDYDRINANAALSQCGTPAAIPALAAQVHHPTDDVKCSAIYALAEIGDEAQLPVFIDALTDRSWAAKGYAVRAISRHGNEQAIPPLCARVRVILGRQRKRQQGGQSELISALEFLTGYQDDDQAHATLAWVAENRRAYLSRAEVEWMHAHGLTSNDE